MTKTVLRRIRRAAGLALATATLLVALSAGSAMAERRVALVIGNSAYRNTMPFDNPGPDARLMAETLRSQGFRLIAGGAQLDLDESGMRRVFETFSTELLGADVALLYFSGLALQLRGINYLAPVDANPVRESDVTFHMLDMPSLLQMMDNVGARLNVVILDAARPNPFSAPGLRAIGRGLAKIEAPRGTLVSLSAQPEQLLPPSTGVGPFARALTQAMRKPGVDILTTFQEVDDEVSKATSAAQRPWLSSRIRADFFFGGPAEVAKVVTPDSDKIAEPWTCDRKCLDAGIRLPGNRTVLFRADQYARFTDERLDKGYPQLIAGRWPFPASWSAGIDAALAWGGDRVYFFRDGQFMRYEIGADGAEIAFPPLAIATHWPSLPEGWRSDIDGAINWGNGKAYFFKGGDYLRYDMVRGEVDPGYPQPIADNWAGFPKEWSSGIDAALNWGGGIVYFFKGDQYLRYDIKTGTADFSFEAVRPVAGNWPGFR